MITCYLQDLHRELTVANVFKLTLVDLISQQLTRSLGSGEAFEKLRLIGAVNFVAELYLKHMVAADVLLAHIDRLMEALETSADHTVLACAFGSVFDVYLEMHSFDIAFDVVV